MLSSCQFGLKLSWEEGAFLKCAALNLNKIILSFKNLFLDMLQLLYSNYAVPLIIWYRANRLAENLY